MERRTPTSSRDVRLAHCVVSSARRLPSPAPRDDRSGRRLEPPARNLASSLQNDVATTEIVLRLAHCVVGFAQRRVASPPRGVPSAHRRTTDSQGDVSNTHGEAWNAHSDV